MTTSRPGHLIAAMLAIVIGIGILLMAPRASGPLHCTAIGAVLMVMCQDD